MVNVVFCFPLQLLYEGRVTGDFLSLFLSPPLPCTLFSSLPLSLSLCLIDGHGLMSRVHLV